MKKHPSDVRPTGIAVAIAAVLIGCASAPVMAQSSTSEDGKQVSAGQADTGQAEAGEARATPVGEARTTLETVHVSATRIESDLLKTPVTVTLSNGATIVIAAGASTGSISVAAPSDDVYADAGTVSATISCG